MVVWAGTAVAVGMGVSVMFGVKSILAQEAAKLPTISRAQVAFVLLLMIFSTVDYELTDNLI
jgi:ABC-type siderophore export system fused ATPase/permease subunit